MILVGRLRGWPLTFCNWTAGIDRPRGRRLSRILTERNDVFMKAGGFFGSINQDTFDAHENVAYPWRFETLLAVSRVLKDDANSKLLLMSNA